MIRVNLKVKFPEVIDNRVFPNIEYGNKIYDAICLDDKGMIYIIDAYGEIRPFPMHYVRIVPDTELNTISDTFIKEKIDLMDTTIKELTETILEIGKTKATKSDSELLDVTIPDIYAKIEKLGELISSKNKPEIKHADKVKK